MKDAELLNAFYLKCKGHLSHTGKKIKETLASVAGILIDPHVTSEGFSDQDVQEIKDNLDDKVKRNQAIIKALRSVKVSS